MRSVQYISEDKARMSRALCLAKGLFRSLRKEERSQSLDIELKWGDSFIRFESPESLGADDMRILQAVVAVATSTGGLELSSHPETPRGVSLKECLDREGWQSTESSLLLEASQNQLSRLAGYSKKTSDKKHIRASLRRLSRVWMTVRQDGGKKACFQLLYWQKPETTFGRMTIVLNPVAAKAVWGGQYTNLFLHEARRLHSDPARLLYQRLCGYIDPGQSRRVGVDKLLNYVWPDAADGVGNQRQRLRRIRISLEEIAQLGWTVVCIDKKVYVFRRPVRKDVEFVDSSSVNPPA